MNDEIPAGVAKTICVVCQYISSLGNYRIPIINLILMKAFISGRENSNQRQAFGLLDKFAFAYLFVLLTSRSQTSGVKTYKRDQEQYYHQVSVL